MNSSFSCVIIGAGISGLMAAHTLQAQGVRVTLVDKGRNVGGRLATRWVDVADYEKGYFDHGAQFFTVREKQFQPFVDEWIAAGIVCEWARGFAQSEGSANVDGHPRYCGVAGMNAIAQHLAAGLDVHRHVKVLRVNQRDEWQVILENGKTLMADALVLTPPAAQSLALMEAGNFVLPDDVRVALKMITYDPCFALLAVLAAPARLPEPGALQLQREPIAWIADNHRKGISPDAFTVTIHAGAEFTREHWDAEHEIVARKLLHAASEWLRAPVQSWQLQRWRYSQPRILHPENCLLVHGKTPLVFAGDGFGAPRVEGAALSGIAAAEKILTLLRK